MVSGEYPPTPGGVGDYTCLLADHLRARGAAVHILTGRPSAASEVAFVDGWGTDALAPVVDWVRAASADVVHLQYQAAAYGMRTAVCGLPLALRTRGVRAPFVTTFHDLRPPYLFRRAGPLRRLPVHFLLGASSGTVFTDPGELARAHPRRPAAWIPIGPNLAPAGSPSRQTERERLGVGADQVVIAHFGFINSSKGIDTLLDAAHRLLQAGMDLRLLFVGEEVGRSDPTNATTAAAIWRRASEQGLEERIIRTGPLSSLGVSSALAAADLAALPYADGASPRRGSLLACLAHGLPTITTQPVRFPDLAATHRLAPFEDAAAYRIDETVAALVPAGDDAALAREVYRLLNDPARLDSLGENGRKFALRLDWEKIASAHLSLYRRLASPGGAT